MTQSRYSQGDRFGGALDAAAKQFSTAHDEKKTPMEFVNEMRKKGQLIMGIGHRVKSVSYFLRVFITVFYKISNNLAPDCMLYPIPLLHPSTNSLRFKGAIEQLNARTKKFKSSFQTHALSE